MSQLTRPSSLIRPLAAAPDIAHAEAEATAPPGVRLARMELDAASELNRRATPQGVLDMRQAPRYSLRQLNALDDEAIAKRLQKLDPNQDAPGWVKFLDLIDLPRNAVANAVTSVFMPEARRRALERGDFDQFGNAKVFGSDVLASMGVENRVLRAVAGFGLDVFTDPLSWIGGPIGGLKTAGVRGGTVIAGKEGQRALTTGLKALRQGRPVADDATRRMIDATLADGIAKGLISEADDVVRQADYVSTTLLGKQGRLSRGAERVGLGKSTREGALADDAYRATKIIDDATGEVVTRRIANEAGGVDDILPSEVDRIAAVKDWVARYTNNRGVDLSKGKGGAEIAHIPFTDRTLTVPAFGPFGRGAAIQKALALASEGRLAEGRVVLQASDDMEEAGRIVAEGQQALENKMAAERAVLAEREVNAPRVREVDGAIETLDGEIDVASARYAAAVEAEQERAFDAAVAGDGLFGQGSPEVEALAAEVDALRARRQALLNERIALTDTPTTRRHEDATAAFKEVMAKIDPRAKAGEGDLVRLDADHIANPETADRIATKFGDEPRRVVGTTPAGKLIVEGVDEPIAVSHLKIEVPNTDNQPIGYLGLRRRDRMGRAFAGNPADLAKISNLGDLMAVAEMGQIASVQARRVQAQRVWADESAKAYRAIRENADRAKQWKQDLARELSEQVNLNLAEATTDEVLSAARREESLAALIEQRERMADARIRAMLELTDESIDDAARLSDAFQKHVETAFEAALYRGDSVSRSLDSEAKLLARGARKLMRLDDAMGFVPFARIGLALQERGDFQATAEALQSFGYNMSKNFGGGQRGLVPQIVQTLRRAATDGAKAEAQAWVNGFRRGTGAFEGAKGFDAIAAKYEHDYADLVALMTLRLQRAVNERAGRAADTFVISEGSATANMLKRLKESGALDDADLAADMDVLIARAVDELESMAIAAALRGDIPSGMQDYFPVQLSPEAVAGLQRVQSTSPENAAGRTAQKAAQALLDPKEARLTNMVEWVRDDGSVGQFLMLDFETIGRLTPDDFADMRARSQLPESEIDRLEEIKGDIEAFLSRFGDDLDEADRERIVRDRARGLMPHELNELAARGHFDAMLGTRLVDQGEMWSTDFIGLMSKRLQAERQQEAVATFRETIEPFIVARVDPRAAQGIAGSDTARTATGQKITNLGRGRFKIGGQIYRHLNMGEMDAESLFLPQQILGAKAEDMLIPEPLAVAVERMNDVLTPRNMNQVMKVANDATGLFKTSTLLHASWTVSNAIGNVLLTAMRLPEILSPGNATAYGRAFKDALNTVMKHNSGGRVRREMGTVDLGGGRFVAVDDIIAEANAQGVINANIAMDAQDQLTRNLMSTRPVGAAAVARNPAEALKNRRDRILAEYAARRGNLGDLSPAAKRANELKATAQAVQKGPISTALRAWFGVNGGVDDTFRLAMYLYLRRQGMDATMAGTEVRQAMLNFGDMTSAEKNIVRPLVPFYAWTRASAPNMLMRLFRDPKQISSVPKLVEAMEELWAGEGSVPRHKRPRWLQETLAIQIGSDPEKARSLQLGTLLPQEPVAQIVAGGLGVAGVGGFDGGDLLDSMSWLGGQAGPAVKLPLELMTSRESFTGRTIGAREGEGDITLNQYLAGQVRWFREAGVGNPNPGALQRAFDQGVGTGLGRLAIGGRLSQNLDDESRQMGLRFEMKDREAEIRKAISRADRRGDQDAGVRLRTELLELYAAHLMRGGNPDDVPKWARDDIGALGAGS